MNLEALGAAWAPRLLSVVRIMSGLLLLEHGTAKWLKPAAPIRRPST
jgi:putative oxidoreductase